jgi:hypothetical protein
MEENWALYQPLPHPGNILHPSLVTPRVKVFSHHLQRPRDKGNENECVVVREPSNKC